MTEPTEVALFRDDLIKREKRVSPEKVKDTIRLLKADLSLIDKMTAHFDETASQLNQLTGELIQCARSLNFHEENANNPMMIAKIEMEEAIPETLEYRGNGSKVVSSALALGVYLFQKRFRPRSNQFHRSLLLKDIQELEQVIGRGLTMQEGNYICEMRQLFRDYFNE